MSEFYGPFEKETGYWAAKHEGMTYCVKPLRLDVRSAKLFIVAGGQLTRQPNEEDKEKGKAVCDAPSGGSHADSGALGLIVLVPNGANLGVVATKLYASYGQWGASPERESVTFQHLGPKGTYGWVVKSGDVHTGGEYELVQVYGVIGASVKLLTTITSYSANKTGAGAVGPLTEISAKFMFETNSFTSLFFPILLRFSGVKNGRPFHSNYRLVFDKKLLTYLAPNNMPDEIKPYPFIALPEPGTLSLACKETETFRPVR